MELKDYLREMDAVHRAALAERCGTTTDYLYQIAGHHREAGPKLARKIHDETNGVISLSDLRPDIWPADAA